MSIIRDFKSLILGFNILCSFGLQASAASKNYISYDLELKPFAEKREQVEKQLNLKLKNRGEAHITVVTPPEFAELSKKMKPERIEALAQTVLSQKRGYEVVCVGSGSLKIKDQIEKTFFVVVKAPELLKLRQTLAVTAGISKEHFDPNLFFPHITLGFTSRDLFYEDGVIKDESSCLK